MAEMDVYEILTRLPHRFPMLLIDRVLECEPGKRIVAVKNVSINEPYFPGHFPGIPIMPGVLILEAMAQAAGVLAFSAMGQQADGKSLYYFAGIDNARFKRPVKPGDQLRIEVEATASRLNVAKFKCVAKVDGQVATEAEIMCTMRPGPTAKA
jgi:3-hydroxyacyl-[acyl-carrier-protein] dehydratase